MNKLRVGVIGLGSWGECHLETLRSLPQVELAAVCDSNKDRLMEVADKFAITDRYADMEQMLLRDDLDLIHVVTFEKNHLTPVLQALRSGKHVLVEKPISTSLEEAKAMQQAARDNKRFLFPGHLLRFEPRYTEIYRAIQGGDIGIPASMYLKRSRQHSLFATYQRTHTVYELMVHDIDLALWYAGSRVTKVRAYGKSLYGSATPEILWACLEFANGMIAFLQSNWMTPDQAKIAIADSAELIGSKGIVHFETSHMGPQIWNEQGRFTPDYHIHTQSNGMVMGALREQISYITHCIINKLDPAYISFADAVHGIEIADAIVQSATTGEDRFITTVDE